MAQPLRTDTREAWRLWYGRRSWRQRRADHLKAEPFCRFCLERGVYTAATVADHITPHRGDPTLFAGPLQSLCKPCHDRDKQLEEHGRTPPGCDADGWPL